MGPLVVLVGADKGGVGKTTISRTLLDYFKANGLETRAFDTEVPKGVLNRFHPNVTTLIDLEKSDDQMKVFDTLTSTAVTVIDLKAGLLTKSIELLTEIGYLEMVNEGKGRLMVMHVIGSTVASFNEIRATAGALSGAQHFVVTNHTNGADFFAGIEGVDKEAMKLATGVIDIPMLDPRATEHVEAASMSFADFAKSGDSFVMRGKVKTWLGTVFQQYDLARLNAQ